MVRGAPRRSFGSTLHCLRASATARCARLRPPRVAQTRYREAPPPPPPADELSKLAQRDIKSELVKTRAANVQLDRQVKLLSALMEKADAAEKRMQEEIERLKEEVAAGLAREKQQAAARARRAPPASLHRRVR